MIGRPVSSVRAVATLFGSALLLAACGGNGDDAPPSPGEPATPAAATLEGSA